MSRSTRLLYRGRGPGMVLGRMPGGKGTASAQELSMQDVALMAQGGSTQAGGVAGVTGATTLAALTDVSLAALADNDLLRYQTSDSKWHNVAKNTYSALITVLGTIATGVWQGTKIALGYGGTNADLSATGGTSKVLMQESAGAAVTVRQLTYTDISGTVPASPDWDDPFIGAWSGGGWGTGPWGGLYYGIIPPSTNGQYWRARGDGITPEWANVATSELTTVTVAPAAGQLGELLSSNVLIGSEVTLTSGVTADVTSKILTAGVWMVYGNLAFDAGGTTSITTIQGWLNTVSVTPPTRPNGGAYVNMPAAFATGTNPVVPVGMACIVVAAGTTQTVYLSSQATFATSTLKAYGFLGALRVA